MSALYAGILMHSIDSGNNYCSPPPSDPKASSSANSFIQDALNQHITAFMTVPALGWIAKGPAPYSQPLPCGCPISVTPGQDQTDPYGQLSIRKKFNWKFRPFIASNVTNAK
jgi:hypothetical protein